VGINENVDMSFDGSTNSNDADEQKVRPFAALAQLQEEAETKH
jgi:hypothetical protein